MHIESDSGVWIQRENPAQTPMPDKHWNTIQVSLGDVIYPYCFGWRCSGQIASCLHEYSADRFLVVTDDHVLALHGDKLLPALRTHAPLEILSLPPSDGMKSLPHLSAHLDRALAAGATRRSVVIAFGGGAPGNLGGMVAALLFRGIRLVHVPTTTMAAMDSVLSLKQAINSRYGKNHIGTYYPPQAVYVDAEFLQTLPDRELRSGLCEAIKNCLAIRPQSLPVLRQFLEDGDFASPSGLLWLLEESLAAKTAVTAFDSKEQRSGLILEYGHTAGHAIELCSLRLPGAVALSHGEAVALGMKVAARVAASLGILSSDLVRLHDQLVAAVGAPTTIPAELRVSDIVEAVRADNKRGYVRVAGDEVAMVLLSGLGRPAGDPDLPLVAVPLAAIEAALRELSADAIEQPRRMPVRASPFADCARRVWSEQLGVEVDSDTDFFLAGGTSLMAMRIISALQDGSGTRIPLRAIFDNPRFSEFVTAAGSIQRGAQRQAAG